MVAGMKWLAGVYTKRFNIRHKLCGHLLAGRYKALVVDGSGNGYLRTVCDYVHLNPVRAGILKSEAPLESFACRVGAGLAPDAPHGPVREQFTHTVRQ